MPACAALKCTNRDDRATRAKGITFHLFPHSEPERLSKWVANMKRAKLEDTKTRWVPSSRSHLCSQHFEEKYFDRTGQTVRLRHGAEPTIFAFPKKKKSKRRKPCAPTTRETPAPAAEPPAPPQTMTVVQQCTVGDHTYAILESAKKIKTKMEHVIDELEACKKKLKVEQQKTRRLTIKVSSLISVIESLCDQNIISVNCAELLESLSGIQPADGTEPETEPDLLVSSGYSVLAL
ncbi:THAP domain-containing protein 6-like [Thalassophryne amazonica]|uniref:THAP domain-containing protein 6-like n=1 Tax=Thalassophryne amazonica TaxID=390379 RepID=UPI001470A475|nr:THAP domain-containing protein 6-like [Thalassophryne amazonica]